MSTAHGREPAGPVPAGGGLAWVTHILDHPLYDLPPRDRLSTIASVREDTSSSAACATITVVKPDASRGRPDTLGSGCVQFRIVRMKMSVEVQQLRQIAGLPPCARG